MLANRLALAALACLTTVSATAQPSQPPQLTVRVWSYGFAPQPIHLAAGRPVTLTFVNESGGGHDFTAPGFFQHARITAGAAQGDEIDLRGHETRSITLIPAAGTYQAHCGHMFHKQLGMHDTIVVD